MAVFDVVHILARKQVHLCVDFAQEGGEFKQFCAFAVGKVRELFEGVGH